MNQTPPNAVIAPPIRCQKLGEFSTANLEQVRAAFRTTSQLTLQQPWLAKAEADFAPGLVRIGWRAETLFVFAELSDADIFEIFLRPEDQKAYVEFQVAPNNRRLQLRFTDAAALERSREAGSLKSVLMPGQAFAAHTWISPATQRWFVLAEIPAASVCETTRPLAGSRWHCSFGRYDHTHGSREPVISSTSGHTQPDFHRLAEWGLLQFST